MVPAPARRPTRAPVAAGRPPAAAHGPDQPPRPHRAPETPGAPRTAGPGRRARSARLGATAVLVCIALAATGATAGSAVDRAADSTTDTDRSALYRGPLLRTLDVRRPFEAPPQRWAAGHRGVDLAAQEGEVVVAPATGVVTFAGTVVDRGVLTITHPDGRRSSLEPVRPLAVAGTPVAAGDVVAVVAGPAHCAPLACLHWGVREDETYVDPLALLPGAGPVVLLPAPSR